MAFIPLSGTGLLGLAAVLLVLYHARNIIHNIYFHPLRHIPGPASHAASRLPYTWAILRCRLPQHVAALHRLHGPVVRLAPNEVSFADPAAWGDVMGGGSRDLRKWDGMYRVPEFMPPHLQNTTDRDHHRMLRRAVGPGFSDAALREQEGLIAGYVDLLVDRLRAESSKGVVDLETWFRYLVFDIIGDLALGESFGCLGGSGMHPWVHNMTRTTKVVGLLTAANMYSVARRIANFLFTKVAQSGFETHNAFLRPLLQRRIKLGTDRMDLVSPLIMKMDEWKMSLDEMISHSVVFIGAGSETTANTLASTISFLADKPELLEKAQKEVRSTFSSSSQINFEAVNTRAPYVVACIDETLRLHPQAGTASLRVTGDHDVICGIALPPKTVVGIWPWGMYRDPKLWTDADEFRPERWLGDPKYANDVREAFKPFFTGSRDCVGKNLALMELRVATARMLFEFDIRLEEDSRDWVAKQRNLLVSWERRPFHVVLAPVQRD